MLGGFFQVSFAICGGMIMEKNLDVSMIDHLLVLVPHQDDEILIGAGLIYEMLQHHKKVTAAIVTNGDYECADFSKGRVRLRETLEGLKTLGLSAEHVFFLGYADTGMSREDSFLMQLYEEGDKDKVFPSSASSFTYGLEEKQDFHYQCYGVHGIYNRATLIEDLRGLICRIRPTCILTTHCSDAHGDHEALFYFIKEVLGTVESSVRPRLLVGLIHSPQGDETWPSRGTGAYGCPAGLEASGLKWEDRLVLPMREELKGGLRRGNLKYEALKKYETALEPGAADYLMAFVKDEEIFWEIREKHI